MDEAKNQINDLEHNEEKTFNSEQQEEKRIQKNEDRVRRVWDNFRHTNIQIIGVLEEEEWEQETENLFEKNNEIKLLFEKNNEIKLLIWWKK